jgi:F plasmid transfer operon, TraF, protein
MSKNSRNRTLIAGLMALVSVQATNAQEVGTRAAGMAGAFVAVADDATAVYWNPAGVATGSLVSVVLDAGSFNSGASGAQNIDSSQDTSAVVALSATAIGVAYYRTGSYGRATPDPAVIRPESREEVRRGVHALTTNTVGVSLVHSLSEHIVIGATPKVMRASGRFAADVDAGVMAWTNRFRVGLVARNLATPEFEGEAREVELDREVRVGGAWGSGWTGISRVIVSFDGDVLARAARDGDRRDLAAGIETWWMDQRIGIRGGARRSTIGDARAVFAAGISAGLRPGMLVEAHVARGHGDEHSWSVGARMTF